VTLCAVLPHQSAISEWDTTGDGCINFQEFCAAMRKAEDVGMSGMLSMYADTALLVLVLQLLLFAAGSTVTSLLVRVYSTEYELNRCL
jgi:EF hand